MGRRHIALAALGGGWILLVASAPPRLEVAAWPEAATVLTMSGVAVAADAQAVPPGEQYPPAPHERALAPAVAAPAAGPGPKPRETEWKLTVDLSVTGDSNRTNGSDLDTVPIDYGEGALPVPLDPSLREKAGIGRGASASAGVRLPVATAMALAFDAEGYVMDYDGARNDDVSALVAAGVELGAGPVPDATVQLIAFDRWYGGVEALQGFGLRANYRTMIGEGQTLRLAVDARIFDSGYGEAFGGTQGSLYLTYDRVLDPRTSASIGAWAHREWLDDDAFSYSEAGIYGGVSRYLGDALTGGVTAGVSRTWFDQPFLMLGPDPRRDWRMSGSLWLMTQRPVIWGVTPSLTYTYNRTASSIGYYRNDRHRLRLGAARSF
ncbi:MAG TPA: surface lipoprotein assembly modifier [Allosphingosinicella sp.]